MTHFLLVGGKSSFRKARTLGSSNSDKDNPIQSKSASRKVKLDSQPERREGLGFASHLARYFLIDSGASFHVVGRNSLTEAEKETIRDLGYTITITTANGPVDVTQAARIYSKELGLEVDAILMEGNTCVLSLGELCTTNRYDFVWRHGRCPFLESEGARI